ncbi:hypothetical protein [Aquipuribacter sp. SD81]|uniref:hypothetical protein n=1 Tax=Aquipuribacter sp. SD81 TaxID=3127703 RepID=UPI0030168333
MHLRQGWAAPTGLVLTAALLAGCTDADPDDDGPTAAAPQPSVTSDAPSEPSPSEAVSEEPSLSPADQAAAEAEAAYARWIAFQNDTLQAPPPISGDGEASEQAFSTFETSIREVGQGEAEGILISTVDQYNQGGWRQVGRTEVTWTDVREVLLDPESPSDESITLRACLTPVDVRVLNADGADVFPELEATPLVSEAVLERPISGQADGWRVATTRVVEEEEC